MQVVLRSVLTKHLHEIQLSPMTYVNLGQAILLHAQTNKHMYRMARNFRGVKFSLFSRIFDEPPKFYPRNL